MTIWKSLTSTEFLRKAWQSLGETDKRGERCKRETVFQTTDFWVWESRTTIYRELKIKRLSGQNNKIKIRYINSGPVVSFRSTWLKMFYKTFVKIIKKWDLGQVPRFESGLVKQTFPYLRYMREGNKKMELSRSCWWGDESEENVNILVSV